MMPEKEDDRPPMIEVNDLTKFYGSQLAIRNLSFTVPRGEIVGFIGPNGAGKTIKTEITKRHLHCVNSQHVYYLFERFS